MAHRVRASAAGALNKSLTTTRCESDAVEGAQLLIRALQRKPQAAVVTSLVSSLHQVTQTK